MFRDFYKMADDLRELLKKALDGKSVVKIYTLDRKGENRSLDDVFISDGPIQISHGFAVCEDL